MRVQYNHTVFEMRLSNVLARKLQNYIIYIDSIEKMANTVTGPNQFSLATGRGPPDPY